MVEASQVVSNRMLWSETGALVGFSEPLIHMFNKNQESVPRERQPNRACALLLGDGLGDATMCDRALVAPETTLKVCFVNNGGAENLKKHQIAFDVCILNDRDGSMETILDIITEIIENH